MVYSLIVFLQAELQCESPYVLLKQSDSAAMVATEICYPVLLLPQEKFKCYTLKCHL